MTPRSIRAWFRRSLPAAVALSLGLGGLLAHADRSAPNAPAAAAFDAGCAEAALPGCLDAARSTDLDARGAALPGAATQLDAPSGRSEGAGRGGGFTASRLARPRAAFADARASVRPARQPDPAPHARALACGYVCSPPTAPPTL